MSQRTDKIIITTEAKVLRYLRNKYDLSMREAGEKIGYSSSYISQIENGRENPPTKARLRKFLHVYGGIGEKYFYELCREWKGDQSDLEVVLELAPKVKPDKLKIIRSMMEQFLKGDL